MAPHRLVRPVVLLSLCAAPILAAQQANEIEPNNSTSSATPAQLGDTLKGEIAFRDIDLFVIDVPAGSKLELVILEHRFCAEIGVSDGQHSAGIDCMSDRHPRDTVYFLATTAAKYYVSIIHSEETPGDENHPPLPYTMRLALYKAPPPGPANPMHVLTTGVDEVMATVPAPNGDLIVMDRSMNSPTDVQRLSRMTPSGQVIPFGTVHSYGQIAVDAFGDLLVPSGDEGGVVWRYNLTTGTRTVFTGPPGGDQPYSGITIGADGDVWLAQNIIPSGATITRFDALGVRKSSVSVPFGVRGMTTSQSGEVFFMSFNAGDVYKLANNITPQRVIAAPSDDDSYSNGYGNYGVGIGSVALDQDGWVYLVQPRQGKLLAFNAQYQLARDPLAQVLDSLHWADIRISAPAPTWLRDANGVMTDRMVVSRSPGFYDEREGPGDIVETNHAGMGAPGADPGLHVDLSPLRAGVLTVTYDDTLRLIGGGTATWTVADGHLPAGLVLSSTGVITGNPTTKGTSEFAVRGTNGARAGFAHMKIVVNEALVVNVTENEIATALMGGTALSTAIVQYLDNLGNKNGRLDAGDFRAYLRSQDRLSGAPKP